MINQAQFEKGMQELSYLDSKIKEMTRTKKLIESELQSVLFQELENKNLKFIEVDTTSGAANLAYKNKLTIDDFGLLQVICGDMILSKVKREIEEKIKFSSKEFEGAVIALYQGNYKEHNLDELLFSLGLDEKQKKTALKKLKGDYIKDKELLESMGAQDDDLEEELDIIKEHKNWELVSRFFGTDEVDLEKLKRAIFVEEILAFGTKFKDKSDESTM
ncbi:MAG: hypothetical protein Q4D65_11015 [Peptostreptococcaceae bacterium]|nr:hypothetical protein [Peptostreptococcaceae bacterium]